MKDRKVSKRFEDEKKYIQNIIINEKAEPFVCKYFGCGRHLSLQERLYGDYCSAHNGKDNWNQTIKYYLKSFVRK